MAGAEVGAREAVHLPGFQPHAVSSPLWDLGQVT